MVLLTLALLTMALGRPARAQDVYPWDWTATDPFGNTLSEQSFGNGYGYVLNGSMSGTATPSGGYASLPSSWDWYAFSPNPYTSQPYLYQTDGNGNPVPWPHGIYVEAQARNIAMDPNQNFHWDYDGSPIGGTVTADGGGTLSAILTYTPSPWDSYFGGPFPAPDHLNLLLTTDLYAYAWTTKALFGLVPDLTATTTDTDNYGETVTAQASSGGLMPVRDGWKAFTGRHLVRVPVVNGVAQVSLSGHVTTVVSNTMSGYDQPNSHSEAMIVATADFDNREVTINAVRHENTNHKEWQVADMPDGCGYVLDQYGLKTGSIVPNARAADGSLQVDIGITPPVFSLSADAEALDPSYSVSYKAAISSPNYDYSFDANDTYHWYDSLKGNSSDGSAFDYHLEFYSVADFPVNYISPVVWISGDPNNPNPTLHKNDADPSTVDHVNFHYQFIPTDGSGTVDATDNLFVHLHLAQEVEDGLNSQDNEPFPDVPGKDDLGPMHNTDSPDNQLQPDGEILKIPAEPNSVVDQLLIMGGNYLSSAGSSSAIENPRLALAVIAIGTLLQWKSNDNITDEYDIQNTQQFWNDAMSLYPENIDPGGTGIYTDYTIEVRKVRRWVDKKWKTDLWGTDGYDGEGEPWGQHHIIKTRPEAFYHQRRP